MNELSFGQFNETECVTHCENSVRGVGVSVAVDIAVMLLNRRFGSGLGGGGSRAGESNIINADTVLTLASAGVLRVFPNKVVHAILGSGECVTLPIGLGNAGLAEFNLPVDIEVEEIAICLAAADIVECHRIAALHRYGQHEL